MNDIVPFPSWTMPFLFFIIVTPWVWLLKAYFKIHEMRVDKLNDTSKIDMLMFHIRALEHVEPYLPPKAPPQPSPDRDPNTPGKY